MSFMQTFMIKQIILTGALLVAGVSPAIAQTEITGVLGYRLGMSVQEAANVRKDYSLDPDCGEKYKGVDQCFLLNAKFSGEEADVAVQFDESGILSQIVLSFNTEEPRCPRIMENLGGMLSSRYGEGISSGSFFPKTQWFSPDGNSISLLNFCPSLVTVGFTYSGGGESF